MLFYLLKKIEYILLLVLILDLTIFIILIFQSMVRLIRILCCAEDIALNNSLFVYDKTKKWFSVCNTLKQVRIQK